MMVSSMSLDLIPIERIQSKIYFFRGRKVMLDSDLALLYGVSTGNLNQAVTRNSIRFPDDFMFQLSLEEYQNLISQIVTSSSKHGGRRTLPRVFTEQGIAMISSVLKSEQAIIVNIQIMRTFTKMRDMLLENDTLRQKVELMEKQYDEQFQIVFDAIHRLLDERIEDQSEIGFQNKSL